MDAFVQAHREENKITSMRFNPFKRSAPAFETAAPVAWAGNAFYLSSRPSFTFDPLFHAGCYYVQEAGSMFLEFALKHTLNLSQPLKILDLCAAPGGKSTLINSLISPESLLVSNELIASRAGILVQNLSKWGTSNTIVTGSDPQRFSALNGVFDALVIDAPCSGSGLFRKQPEAIDEWSPENVTLCCNRQKKILADALPALKEDGLLIYSTCSYSEEENETIVRWLMEEHGMTYTPLPVDPAWGIVDTGLGYRFYPHLVQSEGFFCAALTKTATAMSHSSRKKTAGDEVSKAERALLEPFFTPAADLQLFKKNNQFHLLNTAALGFLQSFEKQLYYKKAGVLAGEIKGKDLVPAHELALALCAGKTVQRVELDLENAISYLRKDNFAVPGASTGLSLITFQGLGIGWAKLLGNRVNNYLPNELRILRATR